MGKKSPDSGPMYMQAMLQAQALASQQQQQAIENQRAQEQFDWSKQAYEDAKAQAVPINQAQLRNMQQQYDIAQQQWDRYTGTFVPLENQYIAKAQGWDTPEAEEAAAGAAQANVAQQLQEGRSAATRALQAYGIDPGAPRYANLEIASRTGGAAATAGAGNQAINQRQLEGLQLLSNAAGMGRNLTPQAIQAGQAGSAAGTGVIGNTNMINQTGASTMGTGLQWGQLGQQYAGLGNQSIAGIGKTFGDIYAGETAQADAQTAGLYGLAGAVVGGVSNYFRPRIPGYAEGGAIPQSASPTQGIAVDDVPARLTPGEFVVPKDVVQWKGEEHFQKLIEQAREKSQGAKAKPAVKPALPIGPGIPEDQAQGSDLPPPGTRMPYTQISPRVASHSNMPTLTPIDLSLQRRRSDVTSSTGALPTSYDELGRPFPGLSPDAALRHYRAPPGTYVSYNSPTPGRPPMPLQSRAAPPQTPQDDTPMWVIDAMRGGG